MIKHEWEREARNWITWVRKPGHDAYWYYRDEFFAEIVPPPGGATLEVGCGEGRVVRDLAGRGHQVVGVDIAPTLLEAAREADPDGEYVLADAAELPFADASFDVVVFYNSLMDVDDMPRAVREAARVLQPCGRLCASVTHPIMDAGRWAGPESNAPFVIEGSYFGRRRFVGTFERAGLTITFRGWCYPFDAYARALEAAGLLIEVIREPGESREDARQERMPLFLWWRATKPKT